MSHFDYYQYQAGARAVRSLEDLRRNAGRKACFCDSSYGPSC
jgi:hypothetical protein